MNVRALSKKVSRQKILDAASTRLREQGPAGTAIAQVMQAAGLTHGAFYSHFPNKDALAQAALLHALDSTQSNWLRKMPHESWSERLNRMGAEYLSQDHCENVRSGCAIAALGSHMAQASPGLKRAYADAMASTVTRICATDGDIPDWQHDQATAFLAQCIGGLTLARAAGARDQSDVILRASREAIGRIAREP